jgi:predicted SprT family Zn-dependent metalloprotease
MSSAKQSLSFEQILEKHLPQKAVNEAYRLLKKDEISLKIVPPRKTLQGSYRMQTAHRKHLITINNNLNPYAFLITLLHEIAHAHAWVNHKAKGHQKEWKTCFQQLLNHFIQLDVFPADIQTALEKHVEKITYSDITDINLAKTLRQYDNNTIVDEKTITLHEIPKNTVFLHGRIIFRKGETLRKYISCKNLTNNRMYRCHPLMTVRVAEENIL